MYIFVNYLQTFPLQVIEVRQAVIDTIVKEIQVYELVQFTNLSFFSGSS